MYSQITADFDITSFASTAAVVQGFLAFFARRAPEPSLLTSRHFVTLRREHFDTRFVTQTQCQVLILARKF